MAVQSPVRVESTIASEADVVDAVALSGNVCSPIVDTSTARRMDGRWAISLCFIPSRLVALGTAVETVRRERVQHLQEIRQVPAGISMNISGAADQLDSTQGPPTAIWRSRKPPRHR
jgi:hypothetical protein